MSTRIACWDGSISARSPRATGQIDDRSLKLAMQEFQTVTQKDPKDADSWVTLGRLYSGTNDNSDAEKAYNAALAADPDNDEALTGLAMVYDKAGDTCKRPSKSSKPPTKKIPTRVR